MALDAWNSFVETPKPGRIIKTAGGPRQRDVIWEIQIKQEHPMGRINVVCPQCGRILFGVTSDMVGELGVCPKCKMEFEIKALWADDELRFRLKRASRKTRLLGLGAIIVGVVLFPAVFALMPEPNSHWVVVNAKGHQEKNPGLMSLVALFLNVLPYALWLIGLLGIGKGILMLFRGISTEKRQAIAKAYASENGVQLPDDANDDTEDKQGM